jgi:hypothetical protein
MLSHIPLAVRKCSVLCGEKFLEEIGKFACLTSGDVVLDLGLSEEAAKAGKNSVFFCPKNKNPGT